MDGSNRVKEKLCEIALELNSCNRDYADLYTSFFHQKPGVPYPYEINISTLAKLMNSFKSINETLKTIDGAEKHDYQEFITAMSEYSSIRIQSADLLHTVLMLLKDKADGKLHSYSLSQYNADVEKLEAYESQIGDIYGPNLQQQYNTVTGYQSNSNPQIKTKKGCYIATCVYGSYDCPQVWTLRRYRDHVLYASASGRLFIRLYYFLSPKLVHCFGNQQFFKRTWKAFLDMKINKLKEKGFADTPYCDL